MSRRVNPIVSARRRGLTLIDMVVTVLVVGILAAAAVPRFAGALHIYRVDAAAKRLVSDLTLARDQAIATSVTRTVSFDSQGTVYTLNGVADPDRPSRTYSVSLAAEPYAVSAVVSLGTSRSVTFNIYGRPDQGGTVTLSSGGVSKVVTVDGTTGRATSS
jgi:Tfp pilus assembly protein FimT